MERLLKPETKRRAIAWIYPVSGIAAALLIFLSLWLVSDENGIETQPTEIGKSVDIGTQYDNISPSEGGDIKSQTIGTTLLSEVAQPITDYRLPITDNRIPITLLNNARYLNIQTNSSNKFASQEKIEISNSPVNVVVAAADIKKAADPRAPALTGKWALSLALSPDLNSVKGIDDGDFGVSVGMGVRYRLGKALSVGTGVYYSQKIYSADKTSYKVTEKPFATWTSYSKRIDADCRVIDVPVNLSLRLSNKTENKIYASAGLSSYIMLSEKYDFVYNNPSPAFPTGRREYTVHNQNKHILSVVNLGVALEKPLSDQVSLVIQPYAKLPLTGIGQGVTELKSFGVGFRLNYSLKKKR